MVFRNADIQLPNITNIKEDLIYPRTEPLAGLKIIKAKYGTFLPDGLGDVTDILAKSKNNNGILVTAGNSLLPNDPAPGSVKELRVEYNLGGQTKYLSLLEGQGQDVSFNGKEFNIIRALYGKFGHDEGIPTKFPVYDVTDKVISFVGSNMLSFSVGDSIFGQGPAGKSEIRELRLTYALEDEIHNTVIPKGEKVHLEQPRPVPVITLADGSANISSPYNGKFTYTIDKSAAKTVEMKNLPEPIVLSGAWELSLPQGSGVSSKKTFSVLRSLSKSEDEEVRYYSGSVSYKKKFTTANDMISKGRSLEMDLGSVREIAEVILNGKNLGIQWIAPFRVDITEAVLPGENNMEIRVTNLWVNRLIGDAQQPDDLKWNEGGPPAVWPKWLFDSNVTRQSKRRTFATWRHWAARSLLKPSGLLGPVVIRSYQNIRL